MPLVNAKKMVNNAYQNKYAIAHINTNTFEWTKVILETAQKLNAPIIIGTSYGVVKYFGGFNIIYALVSSLIKDLNITIDVALHMDHGNFSQCVEALKAGYTSVMYDGSHDGFKENLENTKNLVEIAKEYNASVEAEVGSIGGEEDGVIAMGEIANPIEAKKLAQLGIDFLAAGIGNIHGQYPQNWKGLDFKSLEILNKEVKIPFVLHGGSGIPKDQIQKAISNGVAKINVNTEVKLANAKALIDYVESGEIKKGKNWEPRKLYKPCYDAMAKVIEEKIKEFHSENKN
ncbi:ketose-bisphosphate aldolase [Metamycoplasma buccale]|uniref:ketose-bisphosphate aldolase n=1 Tax=Metamycoplasma buccale TaxID=55602 RepID=UPI00398E521D